MDRVWAALADPNRWRILKMLGGSELSSGEIAGEFALRWPSVSRHLAILEAAGLVRKRSRGRQRVYALDVDGFASATNALARLLPTGVATAAQSNGTAFAAAILDRSPRGDVFIGRRQELVELASVLHQTRVLTITGPPGVGKTRLARELSTRLAGAFGDGVRWVELARVAEPAGVVQAVANSLEATERAGQAPIAAVVARLRSKQVLLVLDNCEHVREACAWVVETLVEASESITVLTTSQAQLGIPGENLWRLSPLSVSDEEQSGTAGDCDAVQLFMARARAIRPDFTIDAEGARAVRELCRQLDGIPLAVELAAARVAVLTPFEIAERLTDRFALLAAPLEAGLERHQTLRGALDWSYGLLPSSQQQLLRRLSVFVGSADLRAIETVCGAETDGDKVLPDLALLVAASLVIGDTSRRRARYRLLETIRAYGLEQVGTVGEADSLRQRHTCWFLQIAEQAEPELTGPADKTWLCVLDADEDNIRAALTFAIRSRDGPAALRLAAAMVIYWRVRNRFSEGRRWLEAAIALGEGQSTSLQMRALWGAGFMALMLNDLDAAVGHLNLSLALAIEAGDGRGRARALLLLGNALLFREASSTSLLTRDAASVLTESVAYARSAGDSWCLAHALGLLGWMRMRAGENAAAREPLEEALAVARTAGDRQGLRLSLTMLGRLALSNGETVAAEQLLTEAVDISEELGDGYGVGAALMTLSETALHRGAYDRAAQLLERAAVLQREAGPSAFRAIYGLGYVALARGDVETAGQRFSEAAAAADETNKDQARIGLGLAAFLQGDNSAAREHFESAQSSAGSQLDAEALAGLGDVAVADGDLVRASSMHHAALEIRRRLHDSPGMVESLERLACVASAGGRHDHAARLLGAVSGLSSAAGFARPSLRQRQVDLALASTRRALGPNAFRVAFVSGKALSLEHAIRYATRGRGARRRPRTGWGSVTPTERSVVALAVQGLSNAEIGKRLFISPHTAAWHLSQVYGKLGISSRGQLAHGVAQRQNVRENNP